MTDETTMRRVAEAKIRVAVVDDYVRLTNSMRDFLEAQGNTVLVAACYTGKELLAQVAEADPQIVILDLELPDIHGLELIRRLSEVAPKVKVIVYTGFPTERNVVAAVRAGVWGWVNKTQPDEDLLAAIADVAAGKTYFPRSILGIVSSILPERVPGRMPERSGRSLTPREIEVMDLIVQQKTTKEIGVRLQIKQTTVKTTINNIYAKLGVREREDAISEYLRARPQP